MKRAAILAPIVMALHALLLVNSTPCDARTIKFQSGKSVGTIYTTNQAGQWQCAGEAANSLTVEDSANVGLLLNAFTDDLQSLDSLSPSDIQSMWFNPQRLPASQLKYITRLTDLKALHLRMTPGFIASDEESRALAETFRTLSHLPKLETIECFAYKPDQFSHLPPTVKSLDVIGDISQKTLDDISKLKSLESLKLRGRIEGKSIAQLKNLKNLRELHFYNASFDSCEHFIKDICELNSLTSLKLDGHSLANTFSDLWKLSQLKQLTIDCTTSEGTFYTLTAPPSIEELKLQGSVGDTTIESCLKANLPNLKHLAFPTGKVSDAVTKYLADKIYLQSVSIGHCTETMMKALSNARNLKHLCLGDKETNGSIFKYIDQLPELESIDFHGTPMTDDGFARITKLPKLTALYLADTWLSPKAWAMLKDLKGLKRLSLVRTNTRDAHLECLSAIPHLESLSLELTLITNASLPHIAKLSELRSLNLSWTKLDDDGIKWLEKLPKLEVLFLDGTHITNSGLKSLAGLTELRNLSLNQTNATPAGLAHLSQLKHLRMLNFYSKVGYDLDVSNLRNLHCLHSICWCTKDGEHDSIKRILEKQMPQTSVGLDVAEYCEAVPPPDTRWFENFYSNE